jgi:N-acetylglucosaminyl-diphospho-decaprenol L-rhamnosyltransferase
VTATAAVTVVVVTYQNRDHIVGCLESLQGQVPADGSQVVVFDNGSADGTPDLVEATFPTVQVVRSEDNLGFARGCNLAAARADTEFILFLNPDAVVEPGCIDALVELARRQPAAGLYGGRTLRPSGELDPMSCWGRPTIWSLFCFASGLSAVFPRSSFFHREGLGGWARDSERQVDIVSGCLLLARRDAWEALGGFDEAFFMYGEDADLGIRARAAGYRSIITPQAEIVHLVGGSSPAIGKEVLLFRGKVTLVDKLWSGPTRALARQLLSTGVWVRARASGRVRSVVTGRSANDTRTAPSTWSALWSRRREWQQGWAGAPR